MPKATNQFLLSKLMKSRGVEQPYPPIPAIKGRHLTEQQHDIIHQIIDALKVIPLIDNELNPEKLFTMGVTGPRRSGKTSLVARLIPLIEDRISFSHIDIADPEGKKLIYKPMNFYLGSMTQEKAISLYWKPIMNYSNSLGLGYKPNTKLGTITTPRGNTIMFKGLRDSVSAAGGLGEYFILVLVDEVQNIREEVLRMFINQVIKPATSDLGGMTMLLGTLPKVPSGYWYDIIKGNKTRIPCHILEPSKNIFISKDKRRAMILDELANAGEKEGQESAWFKREWYGTEIWDDSSLVFNYKTNKNHYLDIDIPEDERNYVIGVDLGFNNCDAFAVMCYSEKTDKVYLVEEDVRSRQDITTCCEKLSVLCDKYNDPFVIVDAGALGKKVLEEMVKRYGINAQAAEKTEKGGWIHITRQALHRGQLKIRQESYAIEEMAKVEFNENQDGWRKNSFHPDLLDAILYSFRYIYNTMHMFWQEPKKKQVIKNQVDYLEKMLEDGDKQENKIEDFHSMHDHGLSSRDQEEGFYNFMKDVI